MIFSEVQLTVGIRLGTWDIQTLFGRSGNYSDSLSLTSLRMLEAGREQ